MHSRSRLAAPSRASSSLRALVLTAVLPAAACGGRAAEPARTDSTRAVDAAAVAAPSVATSAPAAPAASPAPAGVVDSIIPIEESLRRFRADLGAAPRALAGEPSRDALVRRFVRAVEASDTNAFRAMTLSRAEFAYLYYPESPLSRRPYEEPPALLWFRMSQGSNTGIVRALQRYGGRPMGYVSYACEATPKREGPNALWERCRVRHVRAPGDTVEERLFGSIIGRGGRYKIVSYANDF
jgi:hypothetical protein